MNKYAGIYRFFIKDFNTQELIGATARCVVIGAPDAEYNPFEGMYMCDECYWDSKY